jgi:hypothetical protein
MSRQYWSETVAWATQDGTAIANTTTETIIFPNTTVPANLMADGRILRVIAMGRHSTTATPTLTFRLRWGGVAGTVLAASGAITAGSGVTNAIWRLEALLVVRSNGQSGSIFAMGEVELGEDAANTVGSATNATAVGFMGSAGVATPAAVTADLTADTPLALTAAWSAASASNTLTGHILTVEALN